MSEKGGKGGSLLSKGSLKGKEDSATKSAKGRRVQFSQEGGKGDKVANGGKSFQSKDPQPSDPRIDQKLPENVKCLMDCEAADILLGIQEQMITLSRDPTIKIPASFDKGLQYAKNNMKYTNPQSVRNILEPLSNCDLTDSEICVIGNVCPETVDEVYALLPSLKLVDVMTDTENFVEVNNLGLSFSEIACENKARLAGNIFRGTAGGGEDGHSGGAGEHSSAIGPRKEKQLYEKRSIDDQVLKDSVSELAKLRQPMITHRLSSCILGAGAIHEYVIYPMYIGLTGKKDILFYDNRTGMFGKTRKKKGELSRLSQREKYLSFEGSGIINKGSRFDSYVPLVIGQWGRHWNSFRLLYYTIFHHQQAKMGYHDDDDTDQESEKEEPTETWKKHYSSKHKILLVGEGDFSFSLSLAKAFTSAPNLVATSLDSYDNIGKKYSNGLSNVMELQERRCFVFHDVDAKEMSNHFFLKTQRFDRIVYNFPHVGFIYPENSHCQIQLNKRLLKGFFANAKVLLKKEGGEIHVTHKEGEPYNKWGLVQKAEKKGLVLQQVVPFSKDDYPGYDNKRAHGKLSDATFSVGESNTYIFKLKTSFSNTVTMGNPSV
ncbi:hypothetical protein RJT34_14359 [Clitoria ternatea]|uniref:RNA polymerase Rpb4/RPC9 core domain-containing protein n=1 Tax=Clitoria ternatea TaxID=43366 RepID=A0AAN9PN46_CLITE